MTLKSKSSVHYRLVETAGESCTTCIQRIDNGDQASTCSLVEGTVDPEHVCDLFAPEEQRMTTEWTELTDEDRSRLNLTDEDRVWWDALSVEDRKTLTAADKDALDDSDFAYIDGDGDRHLPIHDAAHVRAALSRFNQTQFDSDADKDKAAKKIVAAAEKFDIEVDPSSTVGKAAGLKESKSAQVSSDTVTGAPRRKKPRHRSGPSLGREFRRFAAEGLEVRSASNGNLIEITGSPIVYDTAYSVRDMFGEFQETMAPGVCSQVIARGDLDCRLLFNHDGLPLARTTSGTLVLDDSSTKLNIRAQLDARQQLANDLAVAIERGDVNQMSCGFVVAADQWNDDWTERTIFSFAELLDVSAVTYPASPTTTIEADRSAFDHIPAESRARVRKMFSIAVDLRSQGVEHDKLDTLVDGLSALLDDDEERAAPTATDGKVTKLLGAAHDAVGAVIKAQASDPDNGTDPADADVTKHLHAAHASLNNALKAQGKDNAPATSGDDSERDDNIVGTGGPDGTQNQSTPAPSDAKDGTGSRSADALALELEMVIINRPR